MTSDEVLLEDGRENDLQADPSGRRLDEVHGRLVTCPVDELHPHPSYLRHHLTVPASKLSALAERGDLAFQEPLIITRERTILDGYARLELARLQGRLTLPCIEYELTEVDALRWLLQRHRRSAGLNDFIRILLALELEPLLKEMAHSNQRAGGQNKGSSKLTEAERLDVRSEIAAAAGVSVGNVSKVRQLITSAHSEVLQALRGGEIRIHRAWLWRNQSPAKQIEALRLYRSKKGVNKTIRNLILRHKPKSLPIVSDLANLVRLFCALNSGEFGPVSVMVVKARGKAIYVTEELAHALGSRKELGFPCATKSH